MVLISAHNLDFRFPKTLRPLFCDLNLEIEAGCCFGIIGPSGVGKSTLLKLLVGLLQPQRGEVRYDNVDWRARSAASRAESLRQIGMTLQRTGLFDSLSCGENLSFPLREVARLRGEEAELRVRAALKEVGLQGIENLRVHEISGGMQKRLGLARAFLLKPQTVFLDEPTAGLDPVTARAILDLIAELKAKYQMTVVLVTSDIAQIYRLADQIGFLYEGKFQQIGNREAIENSSQPAVRQFVRGLLDGPLTKEAPRDRV